MMTVLRMVIFYGDLQGMATFPGLLIILYTGIVLGRGSFLEIVTVLEMMTILARDDKHPADGD